MSFLYEIDKAIFFSSMCEGKGSCTMIPQIDSSLLASSIIERISSSLMFSSSFFKTGFIPTSKASFILPLT